MIIRDTTTNDLILCPACNGKGYEIISERINAYETDEFREECYLCKGKRVVCKKITTEYLEI